MAHLYPHKVHGWQVLYNIYFPDSTFVPKVKYSKKKQKAQSILIDVTKLESLCSKGLLGREDMEIALTLGYMNEKEAKELYGAPLPSHKSWETLKDEYSKHLKDNNCRPYTYSCVMSKVKVVLANIDTSIHPGRFLNKDLEAYITKRRKVVKTASINKEIQIFRALLDFHDPQNNVARQIHLLKIDDERLPRALVQNEIPIFLKALEEKKYLLYGDIKPLALTYLYAGLRPTELVSLTPADANLRMGKIVVHAKGEFKTKTGKARGVDIHPDLIPYLQPLVERNGKYLFGGDHKIGNKTVCDALRKVIRHSGLIGVTPYSLRHSFISYLLMAGATLKEVMDMAGHSQIRTTTRYLHVIPRPESPVHKIDFGITL